MLINHPNKIHERTVNESVGQLHEECSKARRDFDAGSLDFAAFDVAQKSAYRRHYERVVKSCEYHGLDASTARVGLRDL